MTYPPNPVPLLALLPMMTILSAAPFCSAWSVPFTHKTRGNAPCTSLDTRNWRSKNQKTSLYAKKQQEEETLSTNTKDESLVTLNNSTLNLTPASHIAYFYLHKTIGLSEDVMWKITITFGSILGLTVSNLQTKVTLLRSELQLTEGVPTDDEDLRTMIRRQPNLLQMSAKYNLKPTMDFLRQELQLSTSELRKILVRFPCLLCYSIKNLQSKISFFRQDLQCTLQECKSLLVYPDHPHLWTSSVQNSLEPKLQFYVKEMLIPIPLLKTMVLRHPSMLLYNLDQDLRSKLIMFFVLRLGMEPHDIHTLLEKYPKILDYRLEERMIPVARYLLTDLGLSTPEVRSLFVKFPRIVTYSLRHIRHLVGFFRYELGLDAGGVKRVLIQAPGLLGLNTDHTLIPRVRWFQNALHLSDEELKQVIRTMPSVLQCQQERTLGPKIDYLREAFGEDHKELKEAVVTLPTLLGYSLEKRIKPRMERIRSIKGLEPRAITVGIPMTEENFELWLGNRREKLKKADLIPKGKKTKRNAKRKTLKKGKKRGGSSIGRRPLAENLAGRDIAVDTSREERQDEAKFNDRKGRIVNWTRRLPPSLDVS